MKIVKAQSFHADGGYRACSFLKLSTDEGLVGWSEYYDSENEYLDGAATRKQFETRAAQFEPLIKKLDIKLQ